MIYRIILALITAAGVAMGSQKASDLNSKVIGVSLETLPLQIQNHPEFTRLSWKIEEFEGKREQSGRWSNPDLSLEYSRETRGREEGLEIGFAQKIPVTSRLQIEKSIAESELRSVQKQREEKVRQLTLEGKRRLIEIYTLKRQRELLERKLKEESLQIDLLEKLAAKGEVSSMDVGQLKIEATLIKLQLEQIHTELQKEKELFKVFLGLSPEEELMIQGTFPTPELLKETAIDQERKTVPAHERLEYLIQSAKEKVSLEKSSAYEDIEVELYAEFSQKKEGSSRKNEEVVGVKLTIPFPLWDRRGGAVRAARAQHHQLESELKTLTREIDLLRAISKRERESWRTLYWEIENSLQPLMEEEFGKIEQAYRDGLIDTGKVFRMREKKRALESEKIRILREFHLAEAHYQSVQ